VSNLQADVHTFTGTQMIRFAAARALQAIATVWFVLTVVFALSRATGNPAALLAPPNATSAEISQLRQQLGLNRPLLSQYASYLNQVLHGNLGTSTTYEQPVRSLILTAFQKTAELGAAAFLFALVVGVGLGLIAGMRRGGVIDSIVRFISLLGQSIPSFALGILLILLLGVKLRVLPTSGSAGLSSIVLPAITLGAYPLAAFARLTRSAVIDVVNKDQTVFLRTKGAGPVALVRHVLRNASLPVVTLAGIQLGTLLSGTIVVETVFAWPGVGQLAVQAVFTQDYALIEGVVILNTIVFMILLFLVDISYAALDPRTRRAHGVALAG
jgi:peptide/nickel transport system permease protein